VTAAAQPYERCREWFGSRQCQRPLGHAPDSDSNPAHGTVRSRYERFAFPAPVRQYIGLPGHEISGQMLPPSVYDAIASAKMSGRPCEYIVLGQQIREDGAVFLQFGVPGAYIENRTDWKVQENGSLRLVCPECSAKDGKHSRTCGYGGKG
jgi:hypothetical protein